MASWSKRMLARMSLLPFVSQIRGLPEPVRVNPSLGPLTAPLPLQRPLLLVTDIDGTLHGDEASMRTLLRLLHHARQHDDPSCRIVYNTGRSLPSFLRLHAREDVPLPDVFVGGTGTEMYTFSTTASGEMEPCPVDEYAEQIASGGWDNAAVRRAVQATLTALERRGEQIDVDADNARNTLKQALTVPRTMLDDFLGILRARLIAEDIPEGPVVQLVICSHIANPELAYIDVVPALADKGAATRWLLDNAAACGAAFAATDVLVCGDSGNDQAMFDLLGDDSGEARPDQLVGGKGVIVGESKPEMVAYARSKAASRDWIHLAQEPAAAGVLEALQHFRWI